ncbi:hypothetical protein X797_002719 [Metarhizium robertsii]|uniref:Uncharacterized protein n=1 Tax=Metarhizium robertsii TaxID=568076 RepID=A0A0A1V469_9HYPO|nr:hypothetical protein X797_002719 [Metarhizium robertsii]
MHFSIIWLLAILLAVNAQKIIGRLCVDLSCNFCPLPLRQGQCAKLDGFRYIRTSEMIGYLYPNESLVSQTSAQVCRLTEFSIGMSTDQSSRYIPFYERYRQPNKL